MNELLWDVWVDTCNCVCIVLYYILICVFVFQGQIKPLYEINPIETTDVSVIPTRTRNMCVLYWGLDSTFHVSMTQTLIPIAHRLYL